MKIIGTNYSGDLVKVNGHLSDRLKRSERLFSCFHPFGRLILFFLFSVQFALSQINWQQTNGLYGGDMRAFTISGTNLFAGV